MTLNQTKSLIKGILKENNKKLVSNINTNIDTKIEENVPNIENVAAFTPIGTIIAVMGNEAPANYLVCDGAIYNITDYQELANYFETQFGSKNHFGGDGTTTFAVPDLRGEFLRGTGTNSHTDQGNGANVGIHQDGTQHEFADHAKNSGGYYMGTYYSNDKEWYNPVNVDSLIGNVDIRAYFKETGHHNNVGTGSYYTSRPTNTSVLYCIATKNIFVDPSLNFSTDEQVVGRWIDGKPIYQKTIIIPEITPTILNSRSLYNIELYSNNDNVKQIIDYNGYYYNTASYGSWSSTIPTSSCSRNLEIQSVCGIFDNILSLSFSNGETQKITNGYVTIRYTKTTD